MALHITCVSGIFVCLTSFLAYLCSSSPNIIVKERDYLYLLLNANFIQAFKQNRIHSLNEMILLYEKIYQHMVLCLQGTLALHRCKSLLFHYSRIKLWQKGPGDRECFS